MSNPVALLRGVGAAGWSLSIYDVTGSTNDLARHLPAWSAVRAGRQTAGRGRFGRSFVSDEGGLWLSAVLPGAGGSEPWKGFSLMVGCHLLRSLKALGIENARLRWPNDLMVGSRKLGGLLIEQSSHEMLIIGLGVNVSNQPGQEDSSLSATTIRLADLLNVPLELNDLASRALDAFANAHEAMVLHGLSAAAAEFNIHWVPYPVELSLTWGETVTGLFMGLDSRGNLRIKGRSDAERVIEHHLVQRLREID